MRHNSTCPRRFTQLGTLIPPWMESQRLDQTFWARKMDGLVVRLPKVWVHFHPIFWPMHMSPTLEGSVTWTAAKIVVEAPSCAGYQKQSNKACLSTTLITVNLTKMEVVVRFNYHMFLHPKWDIDQQQLHSHEQPWIMWSSLQFQPLRPLPYMVMCSPPNSANVSNVDNEVKIGKYVLGAWRNTWKPQKNRTKTHWRVESMNSVIVHIAYRTFLARLCAQDFCENLCRLASDCTGQPNMFEQSLPLGTTFQGEV